MKIKALQIDGFGRFQDFSLELRGGLNLFYGSNEAGKSTLLSFLRAILFGFERRNHPGRYEPERGEFGGELRLDAHFGPLVARRTGGRKAEGDLSVRGADGVELPPSRLSDALGGISRELFYEVFAFGLDELSSFERLAAQGSVSEALFAAGMQGAHRLPLAVDSLRKSSEAIFKPGGHKPPLNLALEDLERVRARLRELGDRPAQHAAAHERLIAVEAELAAAEQEAVLRQREHESLSRLRSALPDLSAIAQMDDELRELGDLSAFPEAGLVRLEELTGRLDAARKEREATLLQLAAVDREQALLARAARGELPEQSLRAALEAFAARVTEHRALPNRTAALAERTRQLSAEEQALGLSKEAPALLELDLGAATRAQLVSLGERCGELERTLAARDEALRAARNTLQQAESEVARLSGELTRLPSSSAPALRGALAALERVEPARREKARFASVGQEKRASAEALGAQVDPAPKELFPSWVLGAIAALLALVSIAVGVSSTPLVTAAVGLGAVGLFFLLALVQRRAAAGHREQLSAHSARAQVRLAELARLRSELAEAAALEQASAAELAELCAAAQMATDASPERFRERELSLREELAGVEKRGRLQEEMEGHSARMASATRADRDAKADRDLVEAALSSVARELSSILAPRGFPSGLSPTAALDLWNEAASLRQRRLELGGEQKALLADQAVLGRLADAVMEAAKEAGLETQGLGVEAAAAALAKLLDTGEEAREQSARLEARRGELSSQAVARERACGELEAAILALLSQGGCTEPEAFRARASRAIRFREARAARRELGSRVDAAVALDVAAAHERVSAAGGAQAIVDRLSIVGAGLEEATRVRRALSDERVELRLRVKTLEEDLEVADLRAKEEALSASATEMAQQYACDRLALGLLARARARFEQEQQPKVIRLASAIFSELTAGRYPKVFLPADKKNELRILDVTGHEWQADRLSRGTREQLYLAFRLAVIEDFGEVRLPLPIILDDILVNFDPERQHRALDVFARLSRRHQVIAFTCHPSVRELFAVQGAHVAEVTADKQLSLVSA